MKRSLKISIELLIESFIMLTVSEREWIDYEIEKIHGGYQLKVFQIKEGEMSITWLLGEGGQVMRVKY